jgi:hypothetical protein
MSRFYGGGLSDFSKLGIDGWGAAPRIKCLAPRFFTVFEKNTFFRTFLRFFAFKIKQNRNSTPYRV